MQAAASSAEELRRLIALLEERGVADRPEARALLERSRRLLAVLPAARPPPSSRVAARKLGALARFALGAGSVLAFLAALLLGAPVLGAPLALICLVAPPIYAAWRLYPGFDACHEAALALRCHLGWAWDWVAETWSIAAARRIEARLAARAIMQGWRRHHASLSHQPTLADLRDWLSEAYGEQAGAAFAARARAILGRRSTTRAWTLRGSAPERRSRRDKAARLQLLRWSALIAEFQELAASGALLPDPPVRAAPLPPPAAPPEPPAAPQEAAESPERARRREALLVLIRQKKQDIQTAHGWKLKTAAEMAQRDAYQAGLRREIAEHERELAALGLRLD